MNKVYLLLGGNLGNKKANLLMACDYILASIGSIVKQSSIYETAPWGFNHDSSFLNQVLLVETDKQPHELLDELLSIEKLMGRTRENESYSARTIDLDILFFNEEVINTKNLTIPHPRIHERNFVLMPLNEIAKEYVHPVFKEKVNTLLKDCSDKLSVVKYNYPENETTRH